MKDKINPARFLTLGLIIFSALNLYPMSLQFDADELAADENEYREFTQRDRDITKDKYYIKMQTFKNQKEISYREWKNCRNVFNREIKSIKDNELKIILKIYALAVRDYKGALGKINNFRRRPSDARKIIEELKGDIFSAINPKPLKKYADSIKDAEFKAKAVEFLSLFDLIETAVCETEGWWMHRREISDITDAFADIISTEGLSLYKIQEIKKLRTRLAWTYIAISHINYICEIESYDDSDFNPVFVDADNRDKMKRWINGRIKFNEQRLKSLSVKSLLLQKDKILINEIQKKIRLFTELDYFFPVDEYYYFLESYSLPFETDKKYPDAVNRFINSFNQLWYRNGEFTLKLEKISKRCSIDYQDKLESIRIDKE